MVRQWMRRTILFCLSFQNFCSILNDHFIFVLMLIHLYSDNFTFTLIAIQAFWGTFVHIWVMQKQSNNNFKAWFSFYSSPDSSFGESQWRSINVRVFALLHKGRLHQSRFGGVKHSAGHTAIWCSHNAWTLSVWGKSWSTNVFLFFFLIVKFEG